MDYQSLHAKTVVELRQIARNMEVRVPAGTNKTRLIELLLEAEATAQRDQSAAKAIAAQVAEAIAGDAPASEAPKRRSFARSSDRRRASETGSIPTG